MRLLNRNQIRPSLEVSGDAHTFERKRRGVSSDPLDSGPGPAGISTVTAVDSLPAAKRAIFHFQLDIKADGG